MKKGLIATTLVGTVLATGIFTGQGQAAEQKQPIHVFTEEEFNENKTGEREGFGGGPGSGVNVVVGDETYQEYLNRVKQGEELNESLAPIEYVYPEEVEEDIQQNSTDNSDKINNQSEETTEQNNNQSTNNEAVNNSNASQKSYEQSESEVETLPETGSQQTSWSYIVAAITSLVGGILLFTKRKFMKQS